ncbi:SAM-dependent methyltransferase [Nocardia callitridis]|uniref:SAM-dependent methyltransferase n=1 Tax=Nocardia callitridis TaxID=648753 RepID=A0ABP9KQ06_9NOCA
MPPKDSSAELSRDHAVDPTTLDPRTPSIARVYDYALGGTNWLEVDREVYEHMKTVVPHQDDVGKANRRWLERVVRYVTRERGIDQVLDLGSGLPTQKNTHEVAQELDAQVEVVYVDNDPVCVARGRELLATNTRTHFLDLDLTAPATVLADPQLRQHLDFDRPLLLIQCGTLHYVDDDGEAAAIMREYIRALAPGSHVMLSHFFDPGAEHPQLHELARGAERALNHDGLGAGKWRTRAQLEPLFDGLELLAPGLVELDEWWPAGPPTRVPWPDEHLILGGLGRKP